MTVTGGKKWFKKQKKANMKRMNNETNGPLRNKFQDSQKWERKGKKKVGMEGDKNSF